MKFKLSPFIILFFLLNSILIFCAFTKIDSEQKPASEMTVKNTDGHARPADNLDPHVDGSRAKKIKTQPEKVSYDSDYINNTKAPEGIKAIMEASAKADFIEGSVDQKIAKLIDAELVDQAGISRQLQEHIKIGAITNYNIVSTPCSAYANK